MSGAPDFADALARTAPKFARGDVTNLKRLSGGASQETWSFDVGDEGFILRRAPGGQSLGQSAHAIGLEMEAKVIRAATAVGAPAPDVVHVCAPEDGVGQAYVMRRLAGETIARKILRDDEFANARPKLARQCGNALAKIHRTQGMELPVLTAKAQLDRYEEIFRSFETPRPTFELAFAELRKRIPEPIEPVLVHGDFRHGNIMVDANGLVAALDWELAHLGDPAEDLGWVCTPSWRFSQTDNEAGGFGSAADLIAGYHEAGGDKRVDEARVRYWTMLGALKWGIMCLTMYRIYESGMDRSVERAAIGRRASETELDLALMFAGKL
ncbi:MAG: phosphotransferase family protein [Hyphomonadaceae bacterium]